MTLPINIPIKIVTGSSIQELLLQTHPRALWYILITIWQYTCVVFCFGLLLGIMFGCALAVIHSLIKIPDVFIDLSQLYVIFKEKLLNALPTVPLPLFENSSGETKEDYSKVASTSTVASSVDGEDQKPIDSLISKAPSEPSMQSPSSSPSKVASTGEIDISDLTSPTGNVFEVASKLPSNFFQEGKSQVDETIKQMAMEEEASQDYHIISYMTPPMSPRNEYTNNDSYNSQPASSNLSSSSSILDQNIISSTIRTSREAPTGKEIRRENYRSINMLSEEGLFKDNN